jgi:hypothetical protein
MKLTPKQQREYDQHQKEMQQAKELMLQHGSYKSMNKRDRAEALAWAKEQDRLGWKDKTPAVNSASTDKLEQAHKILASDSYDETRMRAYCVTFIGYFVALKEYAKGLKGTAYIYEPDRRWGPEGSQEAIVVLPLGTTLKDGEILGHQVRICEIISSAWITPP